MPPSFDMTRWEALFLLKISNPAPLPSGLPGPADPAHDLSHFKRVVRMTHILCKKENAMAEVAVPAAWLHDLVNVPKNNPKRSRASTLSAEEALVYLAEINYPKEFHVEIAHAIKAHSFSAGIEAKTLEAKIVQDADRLDGLGAIGIARCFATAGSIGRPFYCENDPFCETRTPQDLHYTVDHFFQKLFKTAESLHTPSARKEGLRRVESMKGYLKELSLDIAPND